MTKLSHSLSKPNVLSKRTVTTCFKGILVLISLQLVGVFLVGLTLGSSVGLKTPVLSADDAMAGDVVDEAELEARRQGKEQLDLADPRQERILYSQRSSHPEGNQTSLDDYGSRRHFTQKNFNPESDTADAPYLIVGGSDGSGTRAVVNTLVDLGAYFRFEDRRTMDVHGAEMFHREGWPPLVELALKHTHSANYELSDLPEEARSKAIDELGRLKKSIDARAKKKFDHMRDHEGKGDHKKYATATKTGWKAPVSMLLLPLLREVFGPIKFLHVVRDGRDVCLSENQSPVKKFYNTYYGLPNDSPPAGDNITSLSMQLWNDMNSQAMEWGKSHSDGQTFDYLMVRSEDLVNPETRFETLLQLADFVGSRKSLRELCCMSQQELEDLGKSANGFRDPRDPRNRHFRMRGGGEDYMGLGTTKEDFVNGILYGDSALRDEKKAHERYREHRGEARNRVIPQRPHGRGPHHQKEGAIRRLQSIDQGDTHQLHAEDSNLEASSPGSRRLLGPMERMGKRLHDFHRRHGRFKKEAPEQVKARYGKWVKALEDKPELSQKLHELGATSLRAFGYEPPAQFLDPPDETFVLQCQAMLEENMCEE